MIHRRRSTRVLVGIPVSLGVGQGPPLPGLTAVVNRHGALLSSSIQCEEGATLWIRNELNSEVTRCRVVYVGPVDARREQRLGIEFVDEAPVFWGNGYEGALATAVTESSDLGGTSGTRRLGIVEIGAPQGSGLDKDASAQRRRSPASRRGRRDESEG